MRCFVLGMTVALLAPGSAAGMRPSREPLPARMVERPLVVPRGWTRLDLGVARIRPLPVSDTGQFLFLPAEYPERASATGSLRYGVLPGLELRADLGWSWLSVGEEPTRGLEGPELAVRGSLLRSEPPNRSMALEVGTGAASSVAESGRSVGRPTPTAFARLGGRAQWGGLGATLWASGEVFVPHRVAWWTDPDGAPLRIDPGDRVGLDGSLLLQAGPLVVEGIGGLYRRGGGRLRRERGAEPVPLDRAATEADLGGRLTVQLTRGVHTSALWTAPLAAASQPVPWPMLHAPRAGRVALTLGLAL